MSVRRARLGALVSTLALTAACGESPEPKPATRAESILLVTIDTLRADTLGFMGDQRLATPNLDRLAAGGRVFTFAHAHNVVTLPSHANILTGLYPYQHGVRDNGGFVLPATTRTLASRLRDAGFATGAVVAAYPLASRFGLDAGFEVYDASFPEPLAGEFAYPERRGAEVVAAGLEWWRANADRRRFLWIHLFEPHAPYEPPPEILARHPTEPYLGEVEATDVILGPLVAPFLDARESDTLIVVTSDHGEALGEHGEETHGVFAYQPTLRVPLVVWGPGVEAGRDERLARHVDIAPTVLAGLGFDPPAELPGRSLLLPPPGTAAISYFESLSPNLNMAWAPLRGSLEGHSKAIALPLPELYDLAADPEETANLYPERRDAARRQLAALSPESTWPPPAAELDDEERRQLAALGYVADRVTRPERYTEDDDPKRLIGFRTRLNRAADLFHRQRPAEAIAAVESVIAERPEMPLAYSYLASFHLASGQIRPALEVMRRAAEIGMAHPDLERQLGLTLVSVGRPEEALAVLEPLAAAAPEPATLNNLALAYSAAGRSAEAERTLNRALARDPDYVRSHENLSFVLLQSDRYQEAGAAARRALELSPRRPDAWNNLGAALFNLERYAEAQSAFERVVALDPRRLDALFQLGLAAHEAGDAETARRVLERFLAVAPERGFERERQAAGQLLGTP